MKLFVFAALVAVASAARLEHLERSYLPPDNNVQGISGNHGGNGFGTGNNRFGVNGQNSNGFGSNGGSNGFGANSHSSNGFGSNGQTSAGVGSHGQSSNGFGSQDLTSNRFGSNGQNSNGNGASLGTSGFGSSQGSNSFGTNGLSKNAAFGGATSNQYLPPDHGPSGSESGSNGFNVGSAIKPTCFSCGSPARNQYNQGSQAQVPSSNSGVPQLGSRSGSPSAGSNDFGSSGASGSVSQVYGSPSGSQGLSSQPQFGAASRQYLAPKYTQSQNTAQQPFDENTGYIY